MCSVKKFMRILYMTDTILSNKNIGMSRNVLVEYNPNDFFYTLASNDIIIPTEEQCSTLNINDENFWKNTCNTDNDFTENHDNCIQRELCINKQDTDKLTQLQNRHNGSDEKYLNTDHEYNGVILNTINLGIGVLLLTGFIYRLIRK